MKSLNPLYATLLTGALLIPLAVASTKNEPVADTKPLATLLESVQSMDIGVITEAEYEHKFWEIKVCENKGCQKLYIDPVTGSEKQRANSEQEEMPPENALPVSAIVRSVEARGWDRINEIEFDHGLWEIEGYQNSHKQKLQLPVSWLRSSHILY